MDGSDSNSVFPDQLKQAQVVALHKKNNALDKSNYRPVSILPVIAKFFERAIHEQLTEYFNNHFTGLASFNNLADIPSLPVAFLTLVLFICLCTNSSDISLNSRLGISFLFLLISMILGKIL
jgi:hypothetical protein